MRWSALYVPTLRDDPAEAEAVSHRLLVRAGFIRQLSAGHYSLLPLAMRVRSRVIDVIRDEMNRIGGQEFMLPAMHPADIWKRSGRYDVDVMFRLTDRKGNDNVLGLTHEEIFATIATELHSYKQLPQTWYQFQTKFRDEARPKSGLLRVREFTMKDAYSFDVDESGLDQSFDAQKGAYERIFARLGIPAIAVTASSGAMGGSASVEFMCPSSAGEDFVVRCPSCGYAANVEKATSRLASVEDPDALPVEPFDTPGVRTIDDLATRFDVAADRQVKTLVYVIDGEVTLVLTRGDHSLVDQKLIDATGATELRPAHEEEIVAALGAKPGSLGAVGVTSLPILADVALRGRRGMTTGANRDGVHLLHVDVERDIEVGRWVDLREVVAGEDCIECGHSLEVIKCIEIGHIFKLGRKYTEVFGVSVLDSNGKTVTPIMGSYGIGVERAIAAIVETHHDDSGIVWPLRTAPFAVDIVPIGADATPVAEDLYDTLLNRGVDVILDDRNERPGVKFKDAELTGIPLRVTISKRGVEAGTAEITDRATKETVVVTLPELPERLLVLLAAKS
ncbi:proline--tRNA ligase [Stackebrandtia soli]|uniref:proline--tRNA ligase n=1 Tax=Stackebrandtia soli TaxID=1892856 RepID=UPI0039ED7575